MKKRKSPLFSLLLALMVFSGSSFALYQTYELAYLLKYKHDATFLLLEEPSHIKPQSYFFFPDGRVFQITAVIHQEKQTKIYIQRTEDDKKLTITLPCK